MPDPQACCREVSRVLKPEGTVSIFDKFVADGSSPSAARRAANLFTRTFFTDLTRQLGPILDAGGLEAVQRHEVLSGLFTVAVARKR